MSREQEDRMVVMKLDSSVLGFAHSFPAGHVQDGSVPLFLLWSSGCAVSPRQGSGCCRNRSGLSLLLVVNGM